MVRLIDGLAFCHVNFSCCSIESGNERFVFKDDFLFVSEIIEQGFSPESDEMCSFLDIFGILKRNNVQILPGVDFAAVSAFVDWVELTDQCILNEMSRLRSVSTGVVMVQPLGLDHIR
jgi:hypothetical protein